MLRPAGWQPQTAAAETSYSLQFLISMAAASGTAAGVTKEVTFAGITATSNKPRIRVVRLVP